jgi:hypothetical protein
MEVWQRTHSSVALEVDSVFDADPDLITNDHVAPPFVYLSVLRGE